MHPSVRQVVLMRRGYSAEASALFARMTTQPDVTRKGAINTLIGALKTAGVWTKLDALYLLAAADAQSARLNWVQNAYNLSAVSSPTFLADRGYTGDGASSYLDSGFDPTTAPGAKFTQNSGSIGLWIGTDVSSSGQSDIGNSRSSINSRNTTTAVMTMNRSAGPSFTISPVTSVGLSSWSRRASTDAEGYKNGVSIGTEATASSTLSVLYFFLLGRATTGNVLGSPSTRRSQAAFWGSGLTTAEHLALYNALAAYMTAIGA